MKEPTRLLSDDIVSDLIPASTSPASPPGDVAARFVPATPTTPRTPTTPAGLERIVMATYERMPSPPSERRPPLLRMRLHRESIRVLNELPPALQLEIMLIMFTGSSSGS
jgi:hypothetical protein